MTAFWRGGGVMRRWRAGLAPAIRYAQSRSSTCSWQPGRGCGSRGCGNCVTDTVPQVGAAVEEVCHAVGGDQCAGDVRFVFMSVSE